MIQSNELRIGNYIRNEVQGINFQVNSVVIHRLCFGDSEGYSPIELTEEILLKCGFKNEHDEVDGVYYDIYYPSKHTLIDFVIEYKINNKAYYIVSESGEIMSCKIKHLHQLQNLYFALTNEELNVQL